jgi:hypothetical protein
MGHWHVANRANRFNPLDNILAAVNAQVHGPYPVLDGSGGWSPPSSINPLAGRHALAVVSVRAKPKPRKPVAAAQLKTRSGGAAFVAAFPVD